jgi:hypothetical protein
MRMEKWTSRIGARNSAFTPQVQLEMSSKSSSFLFPSILYFVHSSSLPVKNSFPIFALNLLRTYFPFWSCMFQTPFFLLCHCFCTDSFPSPLVYSLVLMQRCWIQWQMADSLRSCALKPLRVLSSCLQKVNIDLLVINVTNECYNVVVGWSGYHWFLNEVFLVIIFLTFFELLNDYVLRKVCIL